MKHAIAAALTATLLLAGCATNTPSPFLNSDPELQVEGATRSLDPERVLGASYVASKALRAGTSKEYVKGLADILGSAASTGVTNNGLFLALNAYAGEKAKYPEDKMLVKYFIAKIEVKLGRLSLPLTAEQKRVLNLYASTLRDTVSAP